MAVIDFILLAFIKLSLWLRYRIHLKGLDTIIDQHRQGILFLPNHPALIDPIILMAYLFNRFKARALADSEQIDRFFIRFMARRARILPLPSLTKKGSDSAQQVRQVIDRCIEALRNGDNLVLYPSGQLMTSNHTVIAANSAVETILKELPDTPIVLVRTSGLWGSSFGWASGMRPSVAKTLKKGFWSILLSGIFFMPRRHVTVSFEIADSLPRQADRKSLNTWLENYFNIHIESNTYVPYSIWEKNTTRTLPEPKIQEYSITDDLIPPTVRDQVFEYLKQQTGLDSFDDTAQLNVDLSMDSLAIAELITWLESEYGIWQINVDSLQTVADVMLAACGEVSGPSRSKEITMPDTKWFTTASDCYLSDQKKYFPDQSICQAFLNRAATHMNKPILADQISGVKTYRDLLLAIILLKSKFEKLPGDRLGIMMPASVASATFYLATLFSGKTPVMVNWTLGGRNLLHTIQNAEVGQIITSRTLLERLQKQNIDASTIQDRLICIEDIRHQVSITDKVKAFLTAHLNWRSLYQAPCPENAVILYTSGSESLPKAVPLTHRNIMTNLTDALNSITLKSDDCLLGILPPFHSFGITVCTVLPLITGIRAVYYPNPTHGSSLAGIIEKWKATLLVGTPTFLNTIVRTTLPGQIDSLRLVVSGAEKCPQRVYDLVHEKCNRLVIIEGYGVTECSPILSVNSSENPIPALSAK